MEDFLKELEKKVGDEKAEEMVQEISLKELEVGLKTLKKRKTPGNRLPTEFYIKSWDIIRPDLLTVCKEILDKGLVVGDIMAEAVVLIVKKGDKEPPKNWQPITLLNTDDKILTKMLMLRIHEVLPHYS